jgi:hypothetical protein
MLNRLHGMPSILDRMRVYPASRDALTSSPIAREGGRRNAAGGGEEESGLGADFTCLGRASLKLPPGNVKL